MKTELGVGMAVLAALAAHGRDFSRAELDAMLDKLAAEPEPKFSFGLVMAACYVTMAPKAEAYEYACPTCGARTHYPRDKYRVVKQLESLRAAAARLKGKGLDIELDERCMCRICGRDLVPTGGEIVDTPKREPMKSQFCWRVGDKIVLHSLTRGRCRISPATSEYWVYGTCVSPTGELLGDGVRVRVRPDVESAVCARLWRTGGWKLKVLPRREGDPEDWVRIGGCVDGRGHEALDARDFWVPRPYIGNLTYGERPGYEFCEGRLQWLLWKINGAYHSIHADDVDILEAFIDQKEFVDLGRRQRRALRSFMSRLRVLLQNIPEPRQPPLEDEAPISDIKDRQHAFEREDAEVGVEVDL